ncbi:hypothetical protein AVP42_02639 [Agromyces sp. NDB4Y10]|nr:hypothetical protein AVP42_02639 [Agromyces sp. NDB4Y10]
MKRRGMTIAAAFVAGAMMLAGGGIAYADTLVAEDELLAGPNLQLGTVDCGQGLSATIDLKLRRQGNTPGGGGTDSPVFANSTAVSITKTSQSNVNASDPSPSTVTTPSNWVTSSTNTLSNAATSTITVDTTTAGSFTGTVSYRASGTNTKGGTHTDTVTLSVRWTVNSCTQPDTTAPVVTLTCPTDDVMLNSTASATWSATDETGFPSGAVTSGSVPLDTSTYGAATASVPAGLVTDAAGNPSAAQSCGYFVTEDIPPVVQVTCPTGEILIGAEVYGNWTATDEGGSGLKTAASGQILAPTTAYGPATLVVPAGTAEDNAGNTSAETSCDYFVTEKTPPVVELTCPTGPFLLGEAVPDAQWTAYDPSPGSGLAGADSGSIPVSTSSVGAKTLKVPAGAVSDVAGNTSLASNECSYSVVYDFTGFFRPVDMGGTLNSVKAGSAVPIKFSLGGDQGLGILDGAPTLKWIACSAGATVDPIEVTVSTAGGSSLSYDPLTNQYNYVWKTDKNWAGKCGTLQVKLNDGTTHTADFKLLK